MFPVQTVSDVPGSCPSRPPHHRTCGSASGGSDRINSRRLPVRRKAKTIRWDRLQGFHASHPSPLNPLSRSASTRMAVTPGSKPWRPVQPFTECETFRGVPRLVTSATMASAEWIRSVPTSLTPAGILPAVAFLSPLPKRLKSVLPRRTSRCVAPDGMATVPGAQISLSKDVNSPCATAPFTSGTEHRASLCGASLPVPSALYGISVRRLIRFDRWLPSHEVSRLRSCFGLMFGPSCLS